jgi:hypothetical protein
MHLYFHLMERYIIYVVAEQSLNVLKQGKLICADLDLIIIIINKMYFVFNL